MVFRYFLPKSKHYRDSEEFKYSQSQMQNAIVGLINGSITSSIWKEDFRAALDARPQLEMYEIPYSPGCEGCNKFDRTASKRATLTVSKRDLGNFSHSYAHEFAVGQAIRP